MPMVEIDELEFQNNKKLRDTVAGILGSTNPKARKLLLQAAKEAYPNQPIPEIDAEVVAQSAVGDLKKQLDDIAKQLADDKSSRESEAKLNGFKKKIDDGFQTLRSQGVMEEGVEKIREIMEQRGIADPVDAWKIFQAENPQQTPADPSGSQSWDFFRTMDEGDDPIKELLESRGDNESTLRKLVAQGINDVRGPRR